MELSSFTLNKTKLDLYKKVFKNKDFLDIVMPPEDSKILEFNQYRKPGKTQFIIYVDLETFIKGMNGCKNNPESWPAIVLGRHAPSQFSISITSSFKDI